MATGYQIYCPNTEVSTYSGKWTGTVTTWAWEYETYVKVRVKFYTTQNYVNEKVQGTDYFYGSAVLCGKNYDFKIAYLGYPGVNSSYTFEEEVDIPFDSSGKADFSFAVTVQGAAGTYLRNYSLSAALSHSFSNVVTQPGKLQLSPSADAMGDTAIIAVTGGEGTIRYRLTYAFGGLTGLIADRQMTEANASLLEVSWVIPDLLEGCPNAAAGILTIFCETYRFDTLIGTSQIQREISAYPPATLGRLGSMRIGYSYDFSITRPSSRYSTKLRYRLLGNEGVIAEEIWEDSYTWDVPLSVGKLMPATESETLYVYCDSYHGTALVGTNSYSCKITALSSNALYYPVIDGADLRTYVPDAPDQFQGLLLQNVAIADISMDAHSDSSELESYSFRGFGTEITLPAENFTGFPGIPVNANSGSHTISLAVTDRRGLTETNYYTLSVMPYNKPKVVPYAADGVSYTSPICYRADREGMATGSGSYMRLMAGRTFSEILSEKVNINAAKLEYRIRKSGEEWPEQYVQVLSYDAKENYASLNVQGAFSDATASYEIELRVMDRVGFSHSYLAKVSSQKVNFSLLCASDGAAFGKTAEHPGVVEIAQDMTLWVRGNLKVDGDTWQELEAVKSGEIWESGYAHGHRTVSGCFWRPEQGNRVLVAFNRAMKWGGNRITVNVDPIPREQRPKAPVSALCPAENGFVLATVGTDGYITVDLAWNTKSATQYNWVDGFIQYWKEES